MNLIPDDLTGRPIPKRKDIPLEIRGSEASSWNSGSPKGTNGWMGVSTIGAVNTGSWTITGSSATGISNTDSGSAASMAGSSMTSAGAS